jgi:hypothetical protein
MEEVPEELGLEWNHCGSHAREEPVVPDERRNRGQKRDSGDQQCADRGPARR